jgi:hypothetical protein
VFELQKGDVLKLVNQGKNRIRPNSVIQFTKGDPSEWKDQKMRNLRFQSVKIEKSVCVSKTSAVFVAVSVVSAFKRSPESEAMSSH